MARLEDLKMNALVKGINPTGPVKVVAVNWYGSDVVEVTYTEVNGRPRQVVLYRDQESVLEIEESGISWGFNADGELFRLVSEAQRIRMAYLFDPWLAIHLSMVEPLPHQISAVYEAMLPRQPLRFLLADDPGAGKTIMAGLYIKELMLRGDLQRCLIVSPGNLTEQWQDELYQKFQLNFELLTNDRIEAARTGNALQEMPLVIARLDKLSRDEALQEKLKVTDWDLIIFDEAHKLSASLFNGEVKYTKRYQLGQLLAGRTRNLLLLTATPHNGKEADFQLFMALVDPDRFEGKFREGVHSKDTSDLMRRLVKEQLRHFDGTPLFPERRAYTVNYQLSDLEASLYEEVTRYVQNEFDRAEHLDRERRGTVGFAMTILQRRLASSPEAIYRSLQRRRKRLEDKLAELELLKRGEEAPVEWEPMPAVDSDTLDEMDDIPEEESEQTTEQVVDQATAARTIKELKLEINRLKSLEAKADQVRHSGQDRKWNELSRLLQEQSEMFDSSGLRRKLVIFTEHRDTLNYLVEKIVALLGKSEAVVMIHGGIPRDTRRNIQARFVQDKDVLVLVATDAAGEGINLQRAHLMINYDLPWNPNRLEQRFGRIHRIGQTEVCHLWNLVAAGTREGSVYSRLLDKILEERSALGDGVFDVLGKLFEETSLRDLLIDAIRYGDQPEVRARLMHKVDNLADRQNMQKLLEERALASDSMDLTRVFKVREEFERAQARRLQPYFVEAFFKAAFEQLGGVIHSRESARWEITHVPAPIRNRTQAIGHGPILSKYERVTFDKDLINLSGKPTAEFLCPGHPLMDAVTDLILENFRGLLRQGTVLLDPTDPSEEPRVLFYLEHSIQDASGDENAPTRVVSRQMEFLEINSSGQISLAGPAPFLNYQAMTAEQIQLVWPAVDQPWLRSDLESLIRGYAVQTLVPDHLQEVRQYREARIVHTLAAVKDRLTKEISYWDHRAVELQAQERAGKPNARLNSMLARRRTEELQARLQKRTEELEKERHIAPQPPVVLGGAVIVPAGLLRKLQGQPPDLFARQRQAVELVAMQAVMDSERSAGFTPRDVSRSNLGWDIESSIPAEGRLRFIEVKGRVTGAETITVTKNEILAGLNRPDDYFLAVVEVEFEAGLALPHQVHCISMPYQREPDFAAVSVNYEWRDLLEGS